MVHFLRVVVKVAVLAIPGSLFYFAEMAPSAEGEQTAELKVIGGGMMNWRAVQKGNNWISIIRLGHRGCFCSCSWLPIMYW